MTNSKLSYFVPDKKLLDGTVDNQGQLRVELNEDTDSLDWLKEVTIADINQDMHYTRGFAQGVWFMHKYGHAFSKQSKFDKLWAALTDIRLGVKYKGKKVWPLMCLLKTKFNLIKS
jgi:hypothetical protein